VIEKTTTTVTREYDADGKMVKETTETVTESEKAGTAVTWWYCHHAGCCCASCRPQPYWQYPAITYTSNVANSPWTQALTTTNGEGS
jgi:hypothetical protein